MYFSIHPQFKFVVDPTDHYTDVDPNKLVEAGGLIVAWIDVTDPTPFQEQVLRNYPFGMYEFEDSTVDEDGVYTDKYPEDPPMHPILKWERDGETAYMYQSAFMSFIKDGVTFVTRVD